MITRRLAIGVTALTVALTALWELALYAGGGNLLSLAGAAPVFLWVVMYLLIGLAENRAKTDMVRISVPQHAEERTR